MSVSVQHEGRTVLILLIVAINSLNAVNAQLLMSADNRRMRATVKPLLGQSTPMLVPTSRTTENGKSVIITTDLHGNISPIPL